MDIFIAQVTLRSRPPVTVLFVMPAQAGIALPWREKRCRPALA
jgi:hypothetical protein